MNCDCFTAEIWQHLVVTKNDRFVPVDWILDQDPLA